jgi:hypothetical protein
MRRPVAAMPRNSPTCLPRIALPTRLPWPQAHVHGWPHFPRKRITRPTAHLRLNVTGFSTCLARPWQGSFMPLNVTELQSAEKVADHCATSSLRHENRPPFDPCVPWIVKSDPDKVHAMS